MEQQAGMANVQLKQIAVQNLYTMSVSRSVARNRVHIHIGIHLEYSDTLSSRCRSRGRQSDIHRHLDIGK